MTELGNLFYNVRLRDLTDQDLQSITQRLRNIGVQADTASLKKSIEDYLAANPVTVRFNPQISSKEIEDKLTGQVINAEIRPLTGNLVSELNAALKTAPVNIDTLSIDPAAMQNAVRTALSGAGFSAVGDGLADAVAKSVQATLSGKTYPASVEVDVKKLSDSIIRGLETAEKRGIKIDTKNIRKDIEDALKSNVKVGLDPQISIAECEKRLQGKLIKAEIVPLATKLRAAIQEACKNGGKGIEVQIGPKATLLQRLVSRVLLQQGYMVNVSTVTGLDAALKRAYVGHNHIPLSVDPAAVVSSLCAAMSNMQSSSFGLTVQKDLLRNSIDVALASNPFNIQIAVAHDQARRAVQNALNNARMMGKDDALAYQRLMTGELKAAQAELARLKSAQQGARNAADAHARASLNLGGAMGSNIRIAGELGAAMTSLYSIHALKNFFNQVVEIGGELEHQKIALETIYGSGSKMGSLYGKIKSLARQSPFGVMELTGNIKQLSAYGVAYNEVYDTAKRLADISAATSIDIQRLILAYGKTKNRTFLDGLEAKQFAYANIPIYDALSKKLTELEGKFVSVKDVMGRIKKREIGFDMVKDILWEMTDEGGKFYNMQEKLAGSVKTSWKLVRDNIELAFGEIAESSTGNHLKGLAEVLQGLTKDWQTLSRVVTIGAIAFGGYKLAVLAHNAVAGKSLIVAAKQHASLKMARYHANEAALSYRYLTKAEEENYLASSGLAKIKGLNVLWSKKLTLAETEALYAKKLLTREDLLRLVAMKKVYATTAEQILIDKTMTATEQALVRSEIAHAAAAKKRVVVFRHLKAAAASALGTLKAFILNPATLGLAALSAAVTLWSKNNEEMDKAKEIGDGIFNKAADGAKGLADILENIKPSKALSDLELSQGIEHLEEAIKDYSPQPIKDINDALVTQDGHLNSLAERYDALRMKVEQLKVAYDGMKTSRFGSMTEGALKATDGGNWFTQLFDDDLKTNAKDYTEALKRREDAIAKFASKHNEAMQAAVDAAIDADQKFELATKGMSTYEAKLSYLAENADKFVAAVNKFNATTAEFDGGDTISDLANSGQINAAYDELISDTDKFIADMNARMRDLQWDPLKLDATQKTELAISLNAILDSMSEAGDDGKAIIAKKWEEAWNIPLTEDRIGPALQKKFRDIVESSTDKTLNSAAKVVAYEGADKLSKAQKEAWEKAGVAAKEQVMHDLSMTQDDMAKYLASNPLTQTINLVYADPKSAPSELAKEIVAKNGYSRLTDSTQRLINQWTKSGSVADAAKAAKEDVKNAKEEYKAAVKLGVGVEKAKKELDERIAAAQYGNFDISSSSKSSSSGRPHRDMLASKFKAEFADLRDGWAEVKKLADSVGINKALREVGESGIFTKFDWKQGPDSIEAYRSALVKLKEELETAGIDGHPERETLYNDLTKKIQEIDRTILDENIRKALDVVNQEIERQTADWDFYEKVFQSTGNRNLAASITFGMNPDTHTDYRTLIRNQYDQIAKAYKEAAPNSEVFSFTDVTRENVTLMSKELQKAYEEARKSLVKYDREQRDMVADMLKSYQSTQDKITAINGERDRKLTTIANNPDLDYNQKQNLRTRVNSEADWKIFQQSGDYLQFFSGIYDLTLSRARQIGDAIHTHLDKQLQDGSISAKEYYDEIERVRQQLDKLRNVRSNAMTLLTSGASGLLDKQYEENASRRVAISQQIEELEQKIKDAKESGDNAARMLAEAALLKAKEELSLQEKIRDKIVSNQRLMQGILDVANVASSIAGGLSESFSTIRDMADSLGFDVESSTWQDMQAVLDSLSAVTDGVSKIAQSALNGNVGGVLSGVTSTLLSPITIWSKLHDQKFRKDIEKSQRQFQKWQYIIDSIERRMEHFLGNVRNISLIDADADIRRLDSLRQKIAAIKGKGKVSIVDLMNLSKYSAEAERLQKRADAYREGGALGYERQLMVEQLAELERQKADMEAMKKKDPEAIADLQDQIDAQRQAIRDFAEEMANTVYGIDLSGWASQIGDALVDAFAKGENAAEAFDKTVSSILRSMVSKMISQDIIAPMFANLRDYLFGADGVSGAYGKDFLLDAEDIAGMTEYLDLIRNEGIPRAQELFDAINDATGGLLNDTESADNSLRAGIQSLTENTGDLLASYVNGIRGDVSLMANVHWPRLLDYLAGFSVIAEVQTQQLRLIAENTRRNMLAAEAMQSSVSTITDILTRATRSKDTGLYIH